MKANSFVLFYCSQLSWKLRLILALILLCNGSTTEAERDETICDQSIKSLTCPLNHVINIKGAQYGRTDHVTCKAGPGSVTQSKCSLQSAHQIVASVCHGKKECDLVVGQPLFPDPCPGTGKYLIVTWECVLKVVSCPAKISRSRLKSAFVTSFAEDGGWSKDSLRLSDKVYYMPWMKYRDGILYEFNSPSDILNSKKNNFHHVKHRVDGTGFIVYDGNLYYNKERSRDLIKYNLARDSIDVTAILPEANYHGTSPFWRGLYSDINFVVDESGLWTIYATEKNNGNIVVSRMNENTLSVVQSWHTSYEKLSAVNAFIACGVLYVINGETLQIDYIYNMTSSTEAAVNIPIPGINITTSSVKYNPSDKSLYIWDNHVASIYEIIFQVVPSVSPISTPTPTVTTSTTSTSTLVSSTTSNAHKPPTQSPADSSKSTTTTPPSNSHGTCSGRTTCGLMWPDTAIGATASLKCPGDDIDVVNWTCGGVSGNPKWMTPEPDISVCGASAWLKRIEKEINDGRTYKVDLSAQLAQELNSDFVDMGVGDIILTTELLNRLSTDLEDNSVMTDDILSSTSALLKPSWKHLWDCMNRQIRTETANKLAAMLQSSAFAFAKDVSLTSDGQLLFSGNSEFKSQPHVTLAIRTEPGSIDPASQKAAIDFRSGTGDVISINVMSLIKSLNVQRTETLAVVYLSYENLASYIEDDGGVGSSDYPVNSRLTTVSVRKLTNHGWSSSSGLATHLDPPLTLRFQRNHDYYSKHVCGYWRSDESSDVGGSWWRAGCKLVQSNASSSTCQCTHLTNFALLSSNKIFPPMGADEPGDAIPDSSDLFPFITLVRAACILSLLLLVFVLIFLFRWRKRSDLTIIHRNFILCAFTSQLILVIGIDLTSVPTLCAVVAGLLHYSVLCCFIWVAIESLHHVFNLSNQLDSHKYWKWYCVAAYVIPVFVVGISVAVDYSAYLNQPACWLCTSGGSMWFIVAPFCIAVFVCVMCVSILMCKLNKRHTVTTDKTVVKTIRWDAIKSCIHFIFLCLMWSFAFIWLSGVPSMAVIFAVMCFGYGLLSFVLHCCFTPLNRLSRSWPLIKDKPDHPRSNNLRTIRGSDGSSRAFGYRYSVPGCETATTLVPFTNRTSNVSYFSAGDELAPLMLVSRDSAMKVQTGDSNMHVSHRSVNGEIKFRESLSSHAEGLEASNTARAHGTTYNFPPPRQHQYEQPSPPGRFCSCTASTSYSCCYDHLHLDPSHNKSSTSPPNRCRCSSQTQLLNPGYFYQVRPHHDYETLKSLSEEAVDGEGHVQLPEQFAQTNNLSCQCHHEGSDAGGSNSNQIQACHVTCRFPHRNAAEQQKLVSQSNCSPTSTWQNSSYGFCPNLYRGGRKNSRMEFCGNHNGRCSDPLSTDQGYDTDSQQPSHHLHSRSDCQGTPESSLSFPEQETNQPMLQRDSSLSGRSDNDREVELINSAGPSGQVLNNEVLTQKPELLQAHDATARRGEIDESSSVIETSVGGSISVSDTISSWSAVPGSNPRSVYPAYGVKNPDRKKNINSQEILEQARLNSAAQRNANLPEPSRVERIPENGYTLPGTAETGTKARIDLISGGVNMITNL